MQRCKQHKHNLSYDNTTADQKLQALTLKSDRMHSSDQNNYFEQRK